VFLQGPDRIRHIIIFTACLINNFTFYIDSQAEIRTKSKVNYAALCKNDNLDLILPENFSEKVFNNFQPVGSALKFEVPSIRFPSMVGNSTIFKCFL